MAEISTLFESTEARCATREEARAAAAVAEAAGFEAYDSSPAVAPGGVILLGRRGIEKSLIVAADEINVPEWVHGFSGDARRVAVGDLGLSVKVCPLDHDNAATLRRTFPHTAPSCVGTKTAAGMGDRLGIATPGHIRAARGTRVVPFLAQQSIREMTRTHRTAEEVMDDATWGVLQEGWAEGFGSDADHLKTTADIDTCMAAGFTMFTVDPGDHVDNDADGLEGSALSERFEAVDWKGLETTAADTREEYLAGGIVLAGDVKLAVDDSALIRAAVKYGAAVSHTAAMYRHLAAKMGSRPFELEMSVDETETATSTFEHYFVARELKRLGVNWVSLAPRFVGDFEKGIDYKGDIKKFEESFAEHMAVVNTLGPYKISIHSGSDKFSIYPVMASLAGGLVHLKTAGTSYLEALRVIGEVSPELFREILSFAFERYDQDKASYHVSADPARVRRPEDLADRELSSVLDGNDGRQLLHVTFGSVLTTKEGDGYLFRDRLIEALRLNEERYYEVLERHLGRHIAPFAAG